MKQLHRKRVLAHYSLCLPERMGISEGVERGSDMIEMLEMIG